MLSGPADDSTKQPPRRFGSNKIAATMPNLEPFHLSSLFFEFVPIPMMMKTNMQFKKLFRMQKECEQLSPYSNKRGSQ